MENKRYNGGVSFRKTKKFPGYNNQRTFPTSKIFSKMQPFYSKFFTHFHETYVYSENIY